MVLHMDSSNPCWKVTSNSNEYCLSQQLVEAVTAGDVLVVYHLLAHGTTGAPGSRLLHVAAETGSLPICQMLIWARIADPCLADPEGRTPLVLARMGGHREVARLLFLHSSEAL
ncbi:AGAP3 [Cordylochernes scorpioides]|uniref:AGAP3 n=1 Tax=Cordylochernes scorpioides TaxID=51811 RepID=A0ABY6LKT4_9ARAC|nr:AGAP3 [Cordylochernes scorpioides]